MYRLDAAVFFHYGFDRMPTDFFKCLSHHLFHQAVYEAYESLSPALGCDALNCNDSFQKPSTSCVEYRCKLPALEQLSLPCSITIFTAPALNASSYRGGAALILFFCCPIFITHFYSILRLTFLSVDSGIRATCSLSRLDLRGS